jgi:hypothetical protein
LDSTDWVPRCREKQRLAENKSVRGEGGGGRKREKVREEKRFGEREKLVGKKTKRERERKKERKNEKEREKEK